MEEGEFPPSRIWHELDLGSGDKRVVLRNSAVLFNCDSGLMTREQDELRALWAIHALRFIEDVSRWGTGEVLHDPVAEAKDLLAQFHTSVAGTERPQ